MLQRIWPWIAAGLSGVLLALCYAPWNQGGLVWLALTPLLCALWFSHCDRPFRLGYVAGVVFFAATFHWIGALGMLYRAPILYGLPLLLALYLALYPAAWAWGLGRLIAPRGDARRFANSWRNLGIGALAASAWTGLEWIREWLFGGFGWNGLSVALHRDLPMIQIAEWTGGIGLSWLAAFVNVMAVVVVRRIVGEVGRSFLQRIRWEFSISVALVMIVFGYGIRTLLTWRPKVAATAQIAAIQPNIPQQQKFDPAFEDEVLDTLERFTVMADAAKPSLILWPESATPRGIFADQETWTRMQSIVAQTSATILLGSTDSAENPDGTISAYNIALSLSATSLAAQTEPKPYRKIHLVPFGEYLPLRFALGPIAGDLVPGDFDAGSEYTVFDIPPVRLAALICFEDTVADLTRRFAAHGAQLLVNLTNDGWFLRTCGAEQHLANAALRAVENRRPLVRCGNTGVTALVQPTGHIDRWIEPHQQGFATKPVEVIDMAPTFYTRHGDWLAHLSVLITLAFCGIKVGVRLRKR